ncbi:MAG TPA: hypothetical protein VEP90_08475, partial [Methylomirabilota bacterium]|nr:hypothetical protein [Methylomirabilota bacterium]
MSHERETRPPASSAPAVVNFIVSDIPMVIVFNNLSIFFNRQHEVTSLLSFGEWTITDIIAVAATEHLQRSQSQETTMPLFDDAIDDVEVAVSSQQTSSSQTLTCFLFNAAKRHNDDRIISDNCNEFLNHENANKNVK